MYPGEDSGEIVEASFTFNGKRKGRPRDIDNVGGLGIVLFWYRTCGAISRTLSLIFGLTSTQLTRWVRFGQRVLLYVLQSENEAKV